MLDSFCSLLPVLRVYNGPDELGNAANSIAKDIKTPRQAYDVSFRHARQIQANEPDCELPVGDNRPKVKRSVDVLLVV